MRVLVAGGAGYIGSVVTAALLADGHEVTVLDDLSTGHADAVPEGAALAAVSLHDSAPVLADVRPEAVLHFAAKSLVGVSQQRPHEYWDTNVGGSLALFEAMRAVDPDLPRQVCRVAPRPVGRQFLDGGAWLDHWVTTSSRRSS